MNDDALPPLLASLLAAVEDRPDDVLLRLHVAELLAGEGLAARAVSQCAAVLERDPDNARALELLSRATSQLKSLQPPQARLSPHEDVATAAGGASPVAAPDDKDTEDKTPAAGIPAAAGFDWGAAEAQVADLVQPAFAEEPAPEASDDGGLPRIRLADVGGMTDVKRRLDVAFLTPMRNPQLRQMYGRSLPGGLLLYGPPGCGKTFLARAIAGEIGAHFYAVSLADVLDMWLGASERNLHEVFETARRNTPSVLFLDEIDALGQKRSHLRTNPAMRGAVNQLLTEMNSVKSDNAGVFLLGATNHPWDVDTALLRPGRFDRMLLVVPPDEQARDAIIRYHLRQRPLEGIDVRKLVRKTEHFSGADLAHLCDSAAQLALEDSVRSGNARPIRMTDFDQALRDVKASTTAWLEDARNVVMFSNSGGRFDELLAYLKQRRMA
jgi:AAA+ superfamily predicted ATPase